MSVRESDAWNFVHGNFAAEGIDGLPLGNGDLGAHVMADHRRTTIYLGKSDVWDERCDCDGKGGRGSARVFKNFGELRRLVETQKWDAIEDRFEKSFKQWRGKYPGKFCLLPAGSLVLDTQRFEKEIEVLQWQRRLDMSRGIAEGSYATRVRSHENEALVSVDHEVLAIKIRADIDWRRGNPPRKMMFGADISLPITLGDPKAKVQWGFERGGVMWRRVRGYHKVDYTTAMLIRAGRGVKVAVDRAAHQFTVTAPSHAEIEIYIAIVSNQDSKNARAEAVRRVRRAASSGFAKLRADHVRWWKRFSSASRVEIPETTLLRQYHFGLYLLASSSRQGFPMPGLQGLWTFKPEGSGWNDYTNDLNIQMNYWPIYVANHLELGAPYYDTVRNWMNESRREAREYYGCRGVVFPAMASPDGLGSLGYITTMHAGNTTAFVAQNFWTHYLFSRDKNFLRDVAYPVLKDSALFYLDFMKKNGRGTYDIWPSNTPEAGEGSYEAWGRNPTMDLSLVRMIFESIIESTSVLDCDSDLREQCKHRLAHFPPYARFNGSLADMESKRFIYSHRHNGMLTPIWPCDDVGGKLAERTIDHFESRGRSLWGAHTVPWQCAANARVGRGEKSHALLREFVTTYTPAQGGFNLNYDFTRSGRGIAGPPVFCNEADSGFSAALLEMLLQSHRELIRIFPAVPEAWGEISFDRLRARGAFIVSAWRSGGHVRNVRITSERGGEIRLRNPWPRRVPQIRSNGETIHPAVRRDVLSWETKPRRTYVVQLV